MDEILEPLLSHLDHHNPGELIGVYLYGSAVSTGLQPDSDLDILAVTHRSLSRSERAGLVELLLAASGWKGHHEQFPEAANRRPLEVTFITLADLKSGPFLLDFQYGEWLRQELTDGILPEPSEDPDVVILLATALQASQTLRGVPLDQLTAPVPPALLRRAVLDRVPILLSEISGDERNVLLTLARILFTVRNGVIVSKDAAAQEISSTRNPDERELLRAARSGYLGEVQDSWGELQLQALALANSLARDIYLQAEEAPISSPT